MKFDDSLNSNPPDRRNEREKSKDSSSQPASDLHRLKPTCFGEPYIAGAREAIDAHAGAILEAGRGAVVHAYTGSIVRACAGSTVRAYAGSFVSAETGALVFVLSSDARVYAERGAIVRINADFAQIKDWACRAEHRGGGIFAEMHGLAYAMPGSTVDVSARILLIAEGDSTAYAKAGSSVHAEAGSVVYRDAGATVYRTDASRVYDMRGNCLD